MTRRRFLAGLARPLALLLGLAVLCACSSVPKPEPQVRTIEVKVPVREACAPGRDQLPNPPAGYADAGLSADVGDAAERYRRIATANEQRKARLALVEPVIAACRP